MAKIKYQMYEVINADGETSQVLPETSADIVTIEDTAQKYTATDVEGALAEIADKLESGLAQAGKIDDVQDVNGQTIVVNKIAKLSKKAVGLDKVDNTADADKVVKEAGKVGHKLAIKSTATNGAEYDGSMPIALAFKDEDFSIAQSSASGTATVTVGVKDKGYAKKTDVDAELAKKYDKTGGTISGDVVIAGGLTVKGSTTTVESETLQVTDALITVAKDNVLPLTSPAGIVVPKADGNNDVALVVDNTNMAQVGKVVYDSNGNIDVSKSNLQTLATRTGLTDDTLVKYDEANKTLVPDTRQYAQKNVDETISGDWTFSNTNGFKTNAIENIDGNRIFDFDGTNNRFGSEAKPTVIRGLNDRPQYQQNGGTLKNIALVDDITGGEITIENATNAENVTKTIAGKAITDIFETNSTTVKKATLAETANVANKVANALTVSGQNGNGTEQTVTYNGSAPITVDYDGNDFTTIVEDGTLAVELVDTGVVPSGQDTAVFSAVQVNSKGIVQNGGLSMEFGKAGQTEPSPSLMVGGLFFERI